MTTLSQRSNRGFTLIELLIVVIIIAILAAIAIPQFSSSTSDAQASAMDADLASIRGAIEMYKTQHANIYPGDVTSTLAQGASCPTGGNNVTGAADSQAALVAQLQYYSNAAGAVCDMQSDTFKYGPYLRQGIPAEPITGSTVVAVTSTGKAIAATADGGWAFDTKSGQFIANNTAKDSGSPQRQYSQH
jgi:prepilin-type N-terminal cleavage/methylation domain-containing protein